MSTEITETSFLDFKCPYCGELNSFPQDTCGLARECVNCMESLIVPEADSDVGRKLPIPLTTPKLVLRRFHPSDWKDLLELASDEEFLVNTDGLSVQGNEEVVREEDVLRWLENDRQVKLTTPDQTFRLAIELKDGSKLMGHLRLSFRDLQRLQAIFSLTLHRNYQRKGFGHEASNALLDFCFKEIGLHRVSASCDSRNAAACGLFEKLGMRREAEFVKDYSFDGQWRNTVWFAMLGEEYRQGNR